MMMEGSTAVEKLEEISIIDGFRIRAYETPPTEPLESVSALFDLNRRVGPPPPRITVNDTPGKSSWVQCDECLKWRRIPQGIRAEDLPETWTCRVDSISCEEEEELSDQVDVSLSASGSIAETRSGTESVADASVSVEWHGLPEYLIDGDHERQNFYAQLVQILRSQGHTLRLYPKLEGEYLDLFTLYQEVVKRGGYVKVSQKKLWSRILAALDIHSLPSRLQSRYEKFLLPLEQAKFPPTTPSMGTQSHALSADASRDAMAARRTRSKSTARQSRVSQGPRGADWPLSKALRSSSDNTVPRSSRSRSGMAGAPTRQSPSDTQLADAAIEKFVCLMQKELTSCKSSLSLLANEISAIDSNLTASLNSYETNTQKSLALVRKAILRVSGTTNQQAQTSHQYLQSASLEHPQSGQQHASKPQPDMLLMASHPGDQRRSVGVAMVQPPQQQQAPPLMPQQQQQQQQQQQEQPKVRATFGQTCTTAAPVVGKSAPVFGADATASARESPVPVAVDRTHAPQQMLHAVKHQPNGTGMAPARYKQF